MSGWEWLFLVSLGAWFFMSHKAWETARRAGYWRGRLDENIARSLEERHGWSEAEDFAAQMHAQQCAVFKVPVPDGWPAWDGVDRLGPRLHPELAETYRPRPRPWWRIWRTWQ